MQGRSCKASSDSMEHSSPPAAGWLRAEGNCLRAAKPFLTSLHFSQLPPLLADLGDAVGRKLVSLNPRSGPGAVGGAQECLNHEALLQPPC